MSDTQLIRIAGAGPSGLSAAITLARAGREVEVHEAKKDVGVRFIGDLQIIEGSSEREPVPDFLDRLGIERNFYFRPATHATFYDHRRKGREVRSETPFGYFIRRGAEEGTLDRGLLAQAQQMEKELNAYGRTTAWRALRAQDKKGILEFRFNLRQLIDAGAPSKIELLSLLEPFVEFVDGFGGISRREILVQHDQEILASVGVLLERGMNLERYEERLAAFKEALDAGQNLYGRSSDFDVFLRNQRKALPQPEALPEQLEQFLVQIAGLSQY